jgi:beta-glucanase (GH16 family)
MINRALAGGALLIGIMAIALLVRSGGTPGPLDGELATSVESSTSAPGETTQTAPPTTTNTTTTPSPLVLAGGATSGEWDLVFFDEFDGDRLDTNRWVTCYWWDDGGCTNLGNHELQWYLPDAVSVRDGSLHLTARKARAESSDGTSYDYVSGMVTTGSDHDDDDAEARFAFQYGYAEMRAKVPAGQGLWSAFWTLPVTHESRPEIDIMEVLGDTHHVLRTHLHYHDSDGIRASVGEDWEGDELGDTWHTYAVEWADDRVAWFIDGNEIWALTDPDAIPHEPMYLLANLAVGGDWPGPPDETTIFPATYEIDYIRVWQRAGA